MSLCKSSSIPSPSLLFKQQLICFLLLGISLRFLVFYVNGTVMINALFCLASLTYHIFFLRFIHGTAYIGGLFIFIAKQYLVVHIAQFVHHLSIDGYLGCLYFQAMANLLYIHVQIFIWICSHFSGVNSQKQSGQIMWQVEFNVLRNC